jgi:hypothetical protein
MYQGPVASPYPGKWICFAMAAFFATLAWRSSRVVVRTMREQRRNTAQGLFFKPDAKKSVGANVAVALVATTLCVTMLAAIYVAWPN